MVVRVTIEYTPWEITAYLAFRQPRYLHGDSGRLCRLLAKSHRAVCNGRGSWCHRLDAGTEGSLLTNSAIGGNAHDLAVSGLSDDEAFRNMVARRALSLNMAFRADSNGTTVLAWLTGDRACEVSIRSFRLKYEETQRAHISGVRRQVDPVRRPGNPAVHVHLF